MRVSCDPESPHFLACTEIVEIFFNGEKLLRCQEADSEEGWADILLPWTTVGEDGYERKHFMRKRLWGQIEIRPLRV